MHIGRTMAPCPMAPLRAGSPARWVARDPTDRKANRERPGRQVLQESREARAPRAPWAPSPTADQPRPSPACRRATASTASSPQFQTSVHYTEYLVNLVSRRPRPSGPTHRAACGNCHAIDGLQQRVSGNVVTTDDAGVVNLASGELQYAAPGTGALSTRELRGQRDGRRGLLHDLPRRDRRQRSARHGHPLDARLVPADHRRRRAAACSSRRARPPPP